MGQTQNLAMADFVYNEAASLAAYNKLIGQSDQLIEADMKRFFKSAQSKWQAGTDIAKAIDEAFIENNIEASLYENVRYSTARAALAGYGFNMDKVVVKDVELDLINKHYQARPWDPKKLKLSDLINDTSEKNLAEIKQRMSLNVKRAGDVTAGARNLFEGYGYGTKLERGKFLKGVGANFKDTIPPQAINKRLDKLANARIAGVKMDKLAPEFLKMRKVVNAGKTAPLRAAYSELLDAIEGGSKRKIEDALQTAINEKTRYVAQRISHTEMERAVHEGILGKAVNDPDCWGIQIKLSPLHKIYDICDIITSTDYGYGPGVYTLQYAPVLPIHPNGRSWEKLMYGDPPALIMTEEKINNKLVKNLAKQYTAGKDLSSIMNLDSLKQLKSGDGKLSVYTKPKFQPARLQLFGKEDAGKVISLNGTDIGSILGRVELANPGKLNWTPKSYKTMMTKQLRDAERLNNALPAFKFDLEDNLYKSSTQQIKLTSGEAKALSSIKKNSLHKQLTGLNKIKPEFNIQRWERIADDIVLHINKTNVNVSKTLGIGLYDKDSVNLQKYFTGGGTKLPPATLKMIKQTSEDISRLAGDEYDVLSQIDVLGSDKKTSFFVVKKDAIGWTPKQGSVALAHEYGHFLHKQPGVEDLVEQFYRKRIGSGTVVDLGKNGIAFEGNFIGSYTGRWYGEVKAGKPVWGTDIAGSEVVSTGIEELIKDPVRLYVYDIEHFSLMRAILFKEVPKK